MTTAVPHVKCVDYWKEHIPENCLKTYKSMIKYGQITKPHCTYNQEAGSTIVEYEATIPHDWILYEMKMAAQVDA